MNAESIIAHVQEQFAALRLATKGSLFHLSISIIGGRHASAAVKFRASVDNHQAGESEADMQTAIRRCIEAGDPKAQAAAIRQQIAALEREAQALETEGK